MESDIAIPPREQHHLPYNYSNRWNPPVWIIQLTLSLFDKELVLSERLVLPNEKRSQHVLSHGVLGLKTSFLIELHAGGTLGNIQSERLTAMVSLAENVTLL